MEHHMSSITLATRTLQTFHECVTRDQGAKWRGYLRQVMPALEDAYREKEDGFRSHMGASLIGRDCAREIWYGFRWVQKPKFEGRMIRLFNRGHMEEGRMIALLLTAGIQVYQQDGEGKQFRISEFGGHFGGSGDGVGVGFPDLQAGQPALTEFKTHNEKSFIKLAGKSWNAFFKGLIDPTAPQIPFDGAGVREAKYEHWVQMQVYMRKMGLACAVYFAVCKNDDHIYAELVYLDPVKADEYITRAGNIIPLYSPPKRIAESLGAYACTFCDYKEVCKMGKAPERNCRTCSYSSVDMNNGTWHCDNKDRQMTMLFGPSPEVSVEGETFQLSKDRQLRGCKYYLANPNIGRKT